MCRGADGCYVTNNAESEMSDSIVDNDDLLACVRRRWRRAGALDAGAFRATLPVDGLHVRLVVGRRQVDRRRRSAFQRAIRSTTAPGQWRRRGGRPVRIPVHCSRPWSLRRRLLLHNLLLLGLGVPVVSFGWEETESSLLDPVPRSRIVLLPVRLVFLRDGRNERIARVRVCQERGQRQDDLVE